MNVRLAKVKAIVRFSDDILSEKKSENFLQSCLSSSVERSCTVLTEWSSDFAIRQRSLESTAKDSWDRKYSFLDEFMSLLPSHYYEIIYDLLFLFDFLGLYDFFVHLIFSVSLIFLVCLIFSVGLIFSVYVIFFQHNFCVKPYVPREPERDPSNHRLNEHGIYIRHCQESNSIPAPSQAEADPTRSQWRISLFDLLSLFWSSLSIWSSQFLWSSFLVCVIYWVYLISSVGLIFWVSLIFSV